jgi:hypothetical protein
VWKEEVARSPAVGERREKRERNKSEEEEERLARFKFFTSRANRTGTTDGHVTKNGWAISHVIVGGMTQSC